MSTLAFDLIPRVPTHNIQDATKVISFMTCPRMYFYEYVLGWQPETPSNHLAFGIAWHKAMEVIHTEGYDADTVLKAHAAFLKTYREYYPPETDELFHPKTPDNALIVLANYANKYKTDDLKFKVLHVEIGGKIAVNMEQYLYFRMDTICSGDRGHFSLEHKTASSFYMWENQWPLSMQVGCYSHVLHCLFPEEEVAGVTMNGVAFKKVKRAWEQILSGQKLTVEPPFDFQRFPIQRTRAQMNTWLWTIQYWLDQIAANFRWLEDCSPDDPMLTAFPMNSTNCTKYNGCPWQDFCNAWQNPLARCDEPPLGHVIRHWNPSAEETQTDIQIAEGQATVIKKEKSHEDES